MYSYGVPELCISHLVLLFYIVLIGSVLQHLTSTTGMKGPQHCPGIDRKRTGLIYVPQGVEKKVVIRGYSFPQVWIMAPW